MTKYLYPIFQTSGKNGCSDLTIALAMFLSDARLGKQQYGPDGVDYEQLHRDHEQLAAKEGELRLFIARHYEALVEAYRAKDPELFQRTVTQCEAKDAAAKCEESEQEAHADLH